MRPEVTSAPVGLSSQAVADLALVADRERRAALRSGNAERLAAALLELDYILTLAADKRTA